MQRYKRKFTEKSTGIIYKSHSTQINLSPTDWHFDNSQSLIPDENLYHELNAQGLDEYGREVTPHVTVLYGLQKEEDYFRAVELLKDFGKFQITVGALAKFEAENYDVLIYKISSLPLEEIHWMLRQKFENTYSFPGYTPHLTIAYVKKGSVDHLLGDNAWQGMNYLVNKISWSHIDGYELEIKLDEKI